MTMPAEVLERLRESVARAERGGAGGPRAEGRVTVGTTVAVSVSPADVYAERATMTMRVSDFSPGGVGLLVGDSIAIGSEVTIHLPKSPDADAPRYDLRCVVCNCRSVADGVFRVGVRYEGVEK